MSRSRTICISVKKKTGDVFNAVLNIPPKLIPDAKIDDDEWWSFIGSPGKSYFKFNEHKPTEILDHQFIDKESTWTVPMIVIPSGDYSEILVTLNKSDELNDKQFDQRIFEMSEMVIAMKNIIESDS